MNPPNHSNALTIDKDIAAQTRLHLSGSLAFQSVDQLMEFSKIMALSNAGVPKHLRGDPGVCLAIAIQASSWEMSPFAVANKTYVVNDRLAYEAQLINAVILKHAPIEGRFEVTYSGEGSKRRCKVSVKLKGGQVVFYESPEIGTIKVKNSPLWQSDPDQQLMYFSSRSMCRRHFPDVILGVYTPDEAQEMRDVTPKERTEPTIQNRTAPPEKPKAAETAVDAELVPETSETPRCPHWREMLVGDQYLQQTVPTDYAPEIAGLTVMDLVKDSALLQLAFEQVERGNEHVNNLRCALDAAAYRKFERRMINSNLTMEQVEAMLIEDGSLPADAKIIDQKGEHLMDITMTAVELVKASKQPK